MRVAVPLHGITIAPRFGCADNFLVVSLRNGFVGRSTYLTMSENATWWARLEALAQKKVTVLLCSGFNKRFEPLATSLGISVITGLSGDAAASVDAYAKGESIFTPHSHGPSRECGTPQSLRRLPKGWTVERLKQHEMPSTGIGTEDKMPGFDRTGPNGSGPRSGGANGRCGKNNKSGLQTQSTGCCCEQRAQHGHASGNCDGNGNGHGHGRGCAGEGHHHHGNAPKGEHSS